MRALYPFVLILPGCCAEYKVNTQIAASANEYATQGAFVRDAVFVEGGASSTKALLVFATGFDLGATALEGFTAIVPAVTSFSREPTWTGSGVGWHWGVAAGDVNGDSYVDVVAGLQADGGQKLETGGVALYVGSATGLSATPSWILGGPSKGGSPVGDLELGDLDADGDLDLVLARTWQPAGKAVLDVSGQPFDAQPVVLLNDGSGVFTASTWAPTGAMGAAALALADFDGDGWLDLALGSKPAAIFLGKPASSSPGVPFATTPDWTASASELLVPDVASFRSATRPEEPFLAVVGSCGDKASCTAAKAGWRVYDRDQAAPVQEILAEDTHCGDDVPFTVLPVDLGDDGSVELLLGGANLNCGAGPTGILVAPGRTSGGIFDDDPLDSTTSGLTELPRIGSTGTAITSRLVALPRCEGTNSGSVTSSAIRPPSPAATWSVVSPGIHRIDRIVSVTASSGVAITARIAPDRTSVTISPPLGVADTVDLKWVREEQTAVLAVDSSPRSTSDEWCAK